MVGPERFTPARLLKSRFKAVPAASGTCFATGDQAVCQSGRCRARRGSRCAAVDGVGLLEAEFGGPVRWAKCSPAPVDRTRSAPRSLRGRYEVACCSTLAFSPRPVVHRSIDFRTNEFRGLQGGEAYEPHEANPLIGYRGCYPFIHSRTCSILSLTSRPGSRFHPQHSPHDPLRPDGCGLECCPNIRQAPSHSDQSSRLDNG